AVSGVNEHRGPLFLSRPPHRAEIHHQRLGRPIFPSGLLAVLLERSARREALALCPERETRLGRYRRAPEHRSVLWIRREGNGAAQPDVELRSRRLHSGEDRYHAK